MISLKLDIIHNTFVSINVKSAKWNELCENWTYESESASQVNYGNPSGKQIIANSKTVSCAAQTQLNDARDLQQYRNPMYSEKISFY